MESKIRCDTHLAIHGLSFLDYRGISSDSAEEFEFTAGPPGGGVHGDLTSGIVLLTLAPMAITALAAFLLRKSRHEDLKIKIEKVYPDGRRETAEIVWRKSAAEAPPADVIREIAKALSLDVAKLLGDDGHQQ